MIRNDATPDTQKESDCGNYPPPSDNRGEQGGWIRVEEKGYPINEQPVWFYAEIYEKVLSGTFVDKDNWDRKNMFISNEGAFFKDVKQWQPLIIPNPPITNKQIKK